jgi:hypothetical protein
MATMTLVYTDEDLKLAEGEGTVNKERPNKC